MIKKLKRRFITRTDNVKGAISIVMVIFLLAVSAAFTMLIDLSTTMYGMKEIQSKIDIAGINALYNSIDYTYLRDETLGMSNGDYITSSGGQSSDIGQENYVELIRNNYIRELQSIQYVGVNPQVRKSEVRFEYSNFGVGYNSNTSTSAKLRPQVVLESIVSYEVSASILTDEMTRNITKSVKSTYNNSTFSVTISDAGSDGKKTVMLHSITRILLK